MTSQKDGEMNVVKMHGYGSAGPALQAVLYPNGLNPYIASHNIPCWGSGDSWATAGTVRITSPCISERRCVWMSSVPCPHVRLRRRVSWARMQSFVLRAVAKLTTRKTENKSMLVRTSLRGSLLCGQGRAVQPLHPCTERPWQKSYRSSVHEYSQ